MVRDSIFNRRVTIFTETDMKGASAGNELLQTKSSPQGKKRWGTMNNWAHAFTPRGTCLAAEENWYAYFKKDDDTANLSSRENTLNKRYAIGAAWNYFKWDTANSANRAMS